jgi:hypothetical protein
MSSTIELDRPPATAAPGPRGRRGRRWLIALTMAGGAAVTTALTAGAYVVSHDGNRPLPDGVRTVDVYTVVDGVSTVVAPADRPGVIGRFLGMCDADSYYMEVGGRGQCLVLNGSLGTVPATGTSRGAQLGPAEAARVRDLVRQADRGDPDPSTRVVLAYDGGWAGLVDVADLNAGGPVTARIIG